MQKKARTIVFAGKVVCIVNYYGAISVSLVVIDDLTRNVSVYFGQKRLRSIFVVGLVLIESTQLFVQTTQATRRASQGGHRQRRCHYRRRFGRQRRRRRRV